MGCIPLDYHQSSRLFSSQLVFLPPAFLQELARVLLLDFGFPLPFFAPPIFRSFGLPFLELAL